MPQVSNYMKATEASNFGFERARKLCQAVIQGDLEEVNALLNDDTLIVHTQDQMGNTVLHYAALNNRPAIIYALIAAGAILTYKNNKLETPLDIALALGHLKCEKALYAGLLCEAAHSDNLNFLETILTLSVMTDLTINKTKNTALHYAALNGNAAMVAALLAAGADFRLLNEDNLTPLDIAEKSNHEDCKRAIFKAERSVALCKAAKRNDIDAVINLLNDNVATNYCLNKERNTPLHYAVQNNNVEMIFALREKNARIMQKNKKKLIPLALAVEMNHWESFHALLRNRTLTKSEKFIIFRYVLNAAKENNVKIMLELLLYYSPSRYPAKNRTLDGNTALHYAVIHNNSEMVLALLQKEKRNNEVNDEGLKAAELACSLKRWNIVSFILENDKGLYMNLWEERSECHLIRNSYLQKYRSYTDENISYLVNAAKEGEYRGFIDCLKKDPYLLKAVVAGQNISLLHFLAINEPEFLAKVIYDIASLDTEYDFISSIEHESHSDFMLAMMHDIDLANKYYGQLENEALIALAKKIDGYIKELSHGFDARFIEQAFKVLKKALDVATKLKNELSYRAVNFQQSLDSANLAANSKELEEVNKKIEIIVKKLISIEQNHDCYSPEESNKAKDILRQFYEKNEQLEIILLKKIMAGSCPDSVKVKAFAKLMKIENPIAQRYIADLNAEGKAYNGLSKKEQAKLALKFYKSQANKGDDHCELQTILLEAKQLQADEESILKQTFASIRFKLKPNGAAAKPSFKGKMSYALKLAFKIIVKKQAEYLKFKAKEFILATTASADIELRCEALAYTAIFSDDRASLTKAKQLNAEINAKARAYSASHKADFEKVGSERKDEPQKYADVSSAAIFASDKDIDDSSITTTSVTAANKKESPSTICSHSMAEIYNDQKDTLEESHYTTLDMSYLSLEARETNASKKAPLEYDALNAALSSAVEKWASEKPINTLAEFACEVFAPSEDMESDLIDFSAEKMSSGFISQVPEETVYEQGQNSTTEILKNLPLISAEKIGKSASENALQKEGNLSSVASTTYTKNHRSNLFEQLQSINASTEPLPVRREQAASDNKISSSSGRLALYN